VLHSNAAPRPAGAPSPLSSRANKQRWQCYGHHRRILRPWAKWRQRGGATALLGEAAAATAATFEGEAQRSVRRRPSGTAAAGCGGCKPEKGEEERHARAGMREGEARDWAGQGQGLGA
jgi:hypothetical protein